MEQPTRVLVIEDDPASLELILDLLLAFGYLGLSAEDGERGLAVARAEQPDSILCDIHMPRLDGFGVVQRLKGDPVLRRIPVIAVTAQAMVGDRERLFFAGFDGYISKPIEPQTFLREMEAICATALRSIGATSAIKASTRPLR